MPVRAERERMIGLLTEMFWLFMIKPYNCWFWFYSLVIHKISTKSIGCDFHDKFLMFGLILLTILKRRKQAYANFSITTLTMQQKSNGAVAGPAIVGERKIRGK